MAKGKKLSDKEVAEIAAEVKNGAGTKKSIAERHGVHPTMIAKILRRANGKKPVKATTKRSTAAAPKKKSKEAEWEKAFNDFIMHRDAAVAEGKLAEVARKKLEKIVKELK